MMDLIVPKQLLDKKYPTTYEEKHLQGKTVIVRTTLQI
jgi:hypothetical protein